MADNRVDLQCAGVIWITPPRVLVPLRSYFAGPIPLDPATQPNNPTDAYRFFTEVMNGLIQPWDYPTFVNPPFGKIISTWCEKFCTESLRGQEIIALLPCGSGRPGTKYWQRCILQPRLNAICYIKGRLAFLKPDGTPVKNNTYPSSLFGFNVNVGRFERSFSQLGKVLRVQIAEGDPAQRASE